MTHSFVVDHPSSHFYSANSIFLWLMNRGNFFFSESFYSCDPSSSNSPSSPSSPCDACSTFSPCDPNSPYDPCDPSSHEQLFTSINDFQKEKAIYTLFSIFSHCMHFFTKSAGFSSEELLQKLIRILQKNDSSSLNETSLASVMIEFLFDGNITAVNKQLIELFCSLLIKVYGLKNDNEIRVIALDVQVVISMLLYLYEIQESKEIKERNTRSIIPQMLVNIISTNDCISTDMLFILGDIFYKGFCCEVIFSTESIFKLRCQNISILSNSFTKWVFNFSDVSHIKREDLIKNSLSGIAREIFVIVIEIAFSSLPKKFDVGDLQSYLNQSLSRPLDYYLDRSFQESILKVEYSFCEEEFRKRVLLLDLGNNHVSLFSTSILGVIYYVF